MGQLQPKMKDHGKGMPHKNAIRAQRDFVDSQVRGNGIEGMYPL